MKEELNLVKIVEDINCRIQDMCQDISSYENFIELSSIGSCSSIKFLNFTIWNSEDDEREWIDDKDDYEDLENYLINKVKEVIQTIKNYDVSKLD